MVLRLEGPVRVRGWAVQLLVEAIWVPPMADPSGPWLCDVQLMVEVEAVAVLEARLRGMQLP